MLARVNSLANKETETTRTLPPPQPPSGTHWGGLRNLTKIAIIAVSLGVVLVFGLFRGWFSGSNKVETDASIVTNVAEQSSMPETFTDSRDGKKYKIVKIGTQTWMAENLNYNSSGSKCYNNNSSNCDKYGGLYNWETAKKACPSGWHLPSNKEWQTLVDFTGGDKITGKKLKAKNGWNDYKGKSGNGTDEFGFSALPGGRRGGDPDSIRFNRAGSHGYWWSATDSYAGLAYRRGMIYSFSGVDRSVRGKSFLFSVRCAKD